MNLYSQTNAYFQGAIHHAKSWKISSEKHEKDAKKQNGKVKELEAELKAKMMP